MFDYIIILVALGCLYTIAYGDFVEGLLGFMFLQSLIFIYFALQILKE